MEEMSVLEKLIKNEQLYGYSIDPDNGSVEITGIVIAYSKEEAVTKITEAYLKHGYSESELSDLSVWAITQGWFKDSPDVLEI